MKLSKVSNRASEDPREVVMRILNHPFIQAFLLCESICYLSSRSDQELAKCTYNFSCKFNLSGLAGYRVLMFRISLVDTFYFAIHTDFEVLNALDSAISQWEIL